MRHIRDFLHIGKRATNDPNQADEARSGKLNPAETLIIAGEAVPRADNSAAVTAKAEVAATKDTNSARLAEVVKSRQKDRWHPPELEGPEFGGLIERRGVDSRGLMPPKYEAKSVEEHRQAQAQAQAEQAGGHTSKSEEPLAGDSDAGDVLEPTGMFLASLDNSAITLADSGMFKITDDEEDDVGPGDDFNPYNRRR